ncbi:MAG: hypothetical protein ACR2J6_06005 [Thermoleophilaceae bacterium]
MPTKRPRHTITETDDVAVAFQRVRAVGADPEPKHLVLLGAQKLVEDVERGHQEEARRAELRERLLARTVGRAVNTEAALDAHERGWAHFGDDIE